VTNSASETDAGGKRNRQEAAMERTYDLDEARSIATGLNIDFMTAKFDLSQFCAGLNVEAEHGNADPSTNVTNDDPSTTGKIALAHLNELPDYYTRLAKMEPAAESSDAAQSAAVSDAPKRRPPKSLIAGAAIVAVVAAFGLLMRSGRRPCSRRAKED
jgi:Protein of unknown function (DUF5661)